MVYVINQNNNPLMPTTNSRARRMIKNGKAKVISNTPFVIKLQYLAREYVQYLTCGIDTGSSVIGSAVVDNNANVLYNAETTIRNDISKKMQQRKSYRSNRRSRKTRYRKPRFLNRASSKRENRLPPTMVSKINSHKKEINQIKKILPISKLILETGNFDIHAITDPSVKYHKWKYQKGIQYDYSNTREYILHRDKHTCQMCKSKNKRMEVHHIIYRRNGGSDNPENLITLCDDCHSNVHEHDIVLDKKGKKKITVRATQMNIIRSQLLKSLDCEETYGYITKEHRRKLGLDKTHYNDAISIASLYNMNKSINTLNKVIYKRHVNIRDKQRTKGIRSHIKIPTGKILGFRKFDKVKFDNNIYFIKGRRSTGYFDLSDIHNNTIKFDHIPKAKNLIRRTCRTSCLIDIMHTQTVA